MQYPFPYQTATAPTAGQTPLFLHPDQIHLPPTPKNPKISKNAIIRLSKSIQKYGILEPLTVQESPNQQGVPIYALLDGRKRLQAAVALGMTQIPCRLAPKNSRDLAITEILTHLQQGELHLFEQAAAFQLLIRDFGLTQQQIAQGTGLSQSAVANKLRLLRLSHEEQQLILTHRLTERHARAVLRLTPEQGRTALLRRIGAEKWTVAATEEQVSAILSANATDANTAEIALKPSKKRQNPQKPAEIPKESPFPAVQLPQTPPKGFLPRKFALHTLMPLYNSIERSLSIFRKTGAAAVCTHQETPDGARIIIEISKEG